MGAGDPWIPAAAPVQEDPLRADGAGGLLALPAHPLGDRGQSVTDRAAVAQGNHALGRRRQLQPQGLQVFVTSQGGEGRVTGQDSR